MCGKLWALNGVVSTIAPKEFAFIMNTAPPSACTVARHPGTLVLTWPQGVSLVLRMEGESILGVGDVSVGGRRLRNPSRLWRPQIATPEGIHYVRFDLKSVTVSPDGGVTLETAAAGFPIGVREEQDEYLLDLVDLSLSDTPVVDRFDWIFAPDACEIGGRSFLGFSYRHRFHSRQGRRLCRLFDTATWEIGGHVRGNELLFQGEVNPPVTVLARDTAFTTACNYYQSEMQGMPTVTQRVSIQRLPRIGTLQAFDFLAHRAGALLGLFEPLEEVFSLIEKRPGEDRLHILDEYRRPRAATFETPRKRILFHAATGAWTREDRRNLWEGVRDFVHTAARRRARIRRSPVLPRVWIPQYCRDTFTLDGTTYPREKGLHALADRRIAAWADMGVREVCLHSIWKSDYTEDRLVCKDHGGMHGALTVGSICNVRVHEIAPLWGGEEALAYFVDKAHGAGLQVQLWWATHVCARAPILREHPEFAMTARDGLPNGGGFGHTGPVTLELNHPACFDWLFGNLRRLHDRTGFDGLFHDSYGNMTLLPLNYADEQRRGQQAAFVRLIRKLQGIGIRNLAIEGIGPFGTGHFGMNLLPSEGVSSFQNALDWWVGQEDMVCGLNMGISQTVWKQSNPDARAFAFRCMAAGGRFGFTQYDADGVEMWTGWLRDMNRIHARIAPIEGRRVYLPQDRGVLWSKGRGAWLFSFRSFVHPVARGGRVVRILPDGEWPEVVCEGKLVTEPGAVYALR